RTWRRRCRSWTTSSCRRPPTRWSGATAATARCRRPSTESGRKPPSRAGGRWTCSATASQRIAQKRSLAFTKHVIKSQLPTSLLQSRNFHQPEDGGRGATQRQMVARLCGGSGRAERGHQRERRRDRRFAVKRTNGSSSATRFISGNLRLVLPCSAWLAPLRTAFGHTYAG